MAWEKRPGGNRYYTRTKRTEDGFVRQYLGCGAKARAAAKADADKRLQRKARRQQEREAWQELTEKAMALRDYCRQTDRWLRLTLEAQGYHQHARGIWRKKRMANQYTPTDWEALDFDCEKTAILHYGPKDDPRRQAILEELARKRPELAERLGSPTTQIREAWLDLLAGNNNLMRQNLEKLYPEWIQGMLSAQPSALERQLVERVVLCGLQVQYADLQLAKIFTTTVSATKQNQMMRFQTMAQSRLLSAIRALTTMQKKLLPPAEAQATATKTGAVAPEAAPTALHQQHQPEEPA